VEQFTRSRRDDPVLSANSVGTPDTGGATEVVVTSDVVYASGTTSTQIWTFKLQDSSWVLVSRKIEGMP